MPYSQTQAQAQAQAQTHEPRSRAREREFNECLIQNHLHAYRAYGIIAIIFYCSSKIIFLFVGLWKCLRVLSRREHPCISFSFCLSLLCSGSNQEHSKAEPHLLVYRIISKMLLICSSIKKFILVERVANTHNAYTWSNLLDKTESKAFLFLYIGSI